MRPLLVCRGESAPLRFQPEQVAFRMNSLPVFIGSGIFNFNGVGAVGAHWELEIGMVWHEIRPREQFLGSWDPGILGSSMTAP
jgi:hypothetical protein